MHHQRRVVCTLAALVFPLIGSLAVVRGDDDKSKRPSLSLKVTPPMAVAPARVRAAVEVRGGANDYEEFYCPTVEWDWGDETISEATLDCEPYEPGRSTIRRRFNGDHTYQTSGNYKVTFRLKRKSKVITSTSANVQIRPGMTEPF